MSLPWKQSILIAVLGGVSCLCASGQDSPSLGDAARQARQQKQSKGTQTKSGTATAAATSKVITNDDIAGGSDAAGDASAGGKNHGSAGSAHSSSSSSSSGSSSGEKMSGEAWKSQIQGQKQAVNALQANLDNLNDSIHFTTGNCVSGCVQWNERQQQKQQEVERMRAQLEQQKQQLHDMQESARQQGYGSSVYDP
ncbi:MAG: hypothetical protein WBV46_11005 [Terriglobales bacterium]|jgi:hypothetical protein